MILYTYEALIALDAEPAGRGKRVSVEATNLAHAKELLEAEYGIGRVVTVWGGWEGEQVRRDK